MRALTLVQRLPVDASPSARCAGLAIAAAPLLGWALAGERWLILGALIMAFLVPVFVRWPVISTFGLYVFLVPLFDSVPYLPLGATLAKPAGLLAGTVMFGAALMERRLRRPPVAALWWSLFVLWAALSSAWSLSPDWSSHFLKRLLSLFLLYLVAVSIKPSESEFHSVCLLVVLGGLLAAAVVQLYGLDAPTPDGRARLVIGDTAANPNALGALILPLALSAAGVLGLRRMVHRVAALACVAAIAWAVFLSMSRGALAAMVAMVLVLLYRVRVRWQVLVIIGALAAIAMTLPDLFFERVGALFTGADSTGSGRLEIWALGLKAIQHFGTFGSGLGNFSPTHDYLAPSRSAAAGAHNSFLMVWVELGIIGLLLMLCAFYSQLRDARAAWRSGSGGFALAALESACIGLLVLNLFGDKIYDKLFWVAWILLAWAVRRDARPERS